MITFLPCRVPTHEDLFYGNMADLRSNGDDTYNNSVLTYCTCDNYNVTATQCGRKAVSDTTADFVEPRTHVSLVVPVQSQRRRRRDVATDIADCDKDFHLHKGSVHPWHNSAYRCVYGKCVYNNANAPIEAVMFDLKTVNMYHVLRYALR